MRSSPFQPSRVKHTPIIARPFCPSHVLKKTPSSQKCGPTNATTGGGGGGAACSHPPSPSPPLPPPPGAMRSPARARMRERSNSRAEQLSLSRSSRSVRPKRVLMRLYCCVISALSKSVVEVAEVMAAASAASGRRDGRWRPRGASGCLGGKKRC